MAQAVNVNFRMSVMVKPVLPGMSLKKYQTGNDKNI